MPTIPSTNDEKLKSQVKKELDDAKKIAKTLDLEKAKSGEWFITLLNQVIKAYDRNARATYFQKNTQDSLAMKLQIS